MSAVFEHNLRAVLNVPGVTAIAGDRIYPLLAPPDVARPYVVWQRIASEPQVSLAGFTSGLERIRVQIDCYADTPDAVFALAAAVRAAVQAATGPVRGITVNETDFFEDDTRLYRRAVDVSVFHRSA